MVNTTLNSFWFTCSICLSSHAFLALLIATRYHNEVGWLLLSIPFQLRRIKKKNWINFCRVIYPHILGVSPNLINRMALRIIVFKLHRIIKDNDFDDIIFPVVFDDYHQIFPETFFHCTFFRLSTHTKCHFDHDFFFHIIWVHFSRLKFN